MGTHLGKMHLSPPFYTVSISLQPLAATLGSLCLSYRKRCRSLSAVLAKRLQEALQIFVDGVTCTTLL